MKLNRLATLCTLGLTLTALVATGCKKKPDYTTSLPARSGTSGGGTARVPDPGSGRPINPGLGAGGTEITDLNPGDTPLPPRGSHEGWLEEPGILAAETINFAFDSSVVRPNDLPKLQNVASYLKSNPNRDVKIEGNCDNRGTEEYNRSLGERRALAAREELIKLGVAPARIETISFGEDRPVDPANTDAAYAKNRRADFVVLSPPGT
jgi:peptidoglycan-associated lipoprotein